jgi:hypothetical protein
MRDPNLMCAYVHHCIMCIRYALVLELFPKLPSKEAVLIHTLELFPYHLPLLRILIF